MKYFDKIILESREAKSWGVTYMQKHAEKTGSDMTFMTILKFNALKWSVQAVKCHVVRLSNCVILVLYI